MAYKRILTIQDISCVGQCSMTVALPILSACGHETCVLPTAVLSTHTGGFGKPVVSHMAEILPAMVRHWQESNITFDAILVGYLGSVQAVHAVAEAQESLLAPGGITIVDPAMADHGKLYSGLDEAYASAMKELCTKADMILPNVTEAAMFAGKPYPDTLTPEWIEESLESFNHPCVILTGIGFREGETGVLARAGENQFHYCHPRLSGSCHGTGDIFAACFTGALMQERKLEDAVKIAADFTFRCIENTRKDPVHWYGVKFETVLPELIRLLQE